MAGSCTRSPGTRPTSSSSSACRAGHSSRTNSTAKLGLKPLSDTPGLEGYSRDSNRVEVGNWPGAQYVVIIVHKKAEIDTPAFREFLSRAVEVVQSHAATTGGSIEAHMPWKKNGERVASGREGLSGRERAKWDRSLLPRLINLIRDIDSDLEFKWDVRDAITIRPNGASRFWARIKTKESDALEVWFTGRRGQTPLAAYENFGRDVALEGDRADGSEVLKLWMVTTNHLQPAELKPQLKKHLDAFHKAFGKGTSQPS